MNRPEIRLVFSSALIGASVPLVWGLTNFLLFNAPESSLTHAINFCARLTCPPSLIPGFWGDLGSPLLNALLYMAGAYVMVLIRRHRAVNNKVK